MKRSWILAGQLSYEVLDTPELIISCLIVVLVDHDSLQSIVLAPMAGEDPNDGDLLVSSLVEELSDGFFDRHAFKPSWVFEVK